MKKRLYFWNDLEIFFPEKKTELELVDKRMQEFFEVISKEGNVIYRYLSLQETRIWCKKIKFYIQKIII